MPRAIGIGSHLILVPLRAEFSRERNDSFLWKFCLSQLARVEEKDREGTERRAWQRVVRGYRARTGARMSWREQVEAMATSCAATMPTAVCLKSVYRQRNRRRDDGEGVA